jgi:predicted nucleic acid-binding protein
MRLLDSNIIIYATKPQFAFLRALFSAPDVAISGVSYVEVLGYHLLSQNDKSDLEELFANTLMLPINAAVLDQAVKFRQQRKITLGDALIAATATVFNCALLTRNTGDFNGLAGFQLVDPVATAGRL